MALADMLPGGKGSDAKMTMEQEAAQLASTMGDAARMPDPYEGTDMSRDKLGLPDANDGVAPAAPAPAPAPQGEAPPPVPAAAPVGEAPPPTPEEHAIPKWRLDEVIQQRRQAEEDKRALERQFYELQAKLNQLTQPAQPQPEAPPDPEQDPIGALKYERTKRAELEAENKRRQEFERAQQMEQQVWNVANHLEAQYKSQAADYDDAVKFLIAERKKELTVAGVPPQFLDQQIQVETRQLVFGALQQQRNPAQVAHDMAKARGFGAARPAATQPGTPAAAIPPAAAPTPPAVAPPATPSKPQAAVNLSASGRPVKAAMSDKEVAFDGTDEDLDNLWSDMQQSAAKRKRAPIWDQRGKRKSG